MASIISLAIDRQRMLYEVYVKSSWYIAVHVLVGYIHYQPWIHSVCCSFHSNIFNAIKWPDLTISINKSIQANTSISITVKFVLMHNEVNNEGILNAVKDQYTYNRLSSSWSPSHYTCNAYMREESWFDWTHKKNKIDLALLALKKVSCLTLLFYKCYQI